jgi:hypothetical protein
MYFQRKLRRADAPDEYFEEERGYDEEQQNMSDDGTPPVSSYDEDRHVGDATDIFLTKNARDRLARQRAEQEVSGV